MSHHPASHGEAHHEEHGSYSTYIGVFVALLVLTAISLVVGNSQTLREQTPRVMWAAMMAVSCAKAMLVMLFFMHLKWEANWKYVLTIPASIMSVFLVLMLIPDVGERVKKYSEERYLYATDPAFNPHHGHKDEVAHEHDEKQGHKGHAPSKVQH